MKHILSTKHLTPSQKNLLSNFEVDAIAFTKVELGSSVVIDKQISNAIFTSQNAVKAVFEVSKIASKFFEKVYCVGKKTAELLRLHGLQTEIVATNAQDLANKITPIKPTQVHFFCGNFRRDELPNVLQTNGIEVIEHVVYKTLLTPQKLTKNYDGVLFFSPSAVKSYLSVGNAVDTTAFCIGETTAGEASNVFESVVVGENGTVEGLIKQVNIAFKNNT